MVYPQDGDESSTTHHQTGDIGQLERAEQRNHAGPQHGAHGLHSKDYAYPVGCILIALAGYVGRTPALGGNGSWRVGPHVHEGGPAEELHQAYGDEGVGDAHLLLRRGLCGLRGDDFGLFRTKLLHLFGRVLLDVHRGIDHAEYQDGCADVEGVDDGVGDDALWGCVLHAQEGEDVGEEITHQRAGVAEERLDTVGQTLLADVHHVAHHHLKGLHGDVDRGVEEHERHQTKQHSARQSPHHHLRGESQ